MTFSPQRRSLVLAALVAPIAGCALAAPCNGAFAREVAKIEAASGVWPPGRPPIVIAVYFTQSPRQRNDVVAAAARAVSAAFTAV